MFEGPEKRKAGVRAAQAAVEERLDEEGVRAVREGEVWGRMPGETDRSYEAFEIYREMGSGRTMEGVREELVRRHGVERRWTTLRQWKVEYRWDARAWAFDRVRDREKMKGEALARRKVAKETEERRLKQLARHEEESLGLARELKLKALKMLQWGLEETETTRVETSEDGKTTVVHQTVMPAKWTMRDVPVFLKVGHDLERETLGLARSPVPGRAGEPAISPDPDGLGDLERQTSAEVLQGAGRRLAAFEAEQRARRMRFPRRDVAPAGLGVVAAPDGTGDGASAEVPAVTNGNGHSNGNGSNGHGNGNGHG
jgi:hypothetical protein